jgi:hypothetical protein
MDVSDLMEQAYQGNQKDKENQKALEEARDVPVIKDIINLKYGNQNGSTTPPGGRQSPGSVPTPPAGSQAPVESPEPSTSLSQETEESPAEKKDDDETLFNRETAADPSSAFSV